MYSVSWICGDVTDEILVPGDDDDQAREVARVVVWSRYYPHLSRNAIITGDCRYVGAASEFV